MLKKYTFFCRKNEIWKKSVGSWLRKKKFFFKTEENSTVYWSFDSTLYEPPESRERKFKCEKCIEEFTSYESRRQHINKDHFFQTIRGIHSKKSKRTKKDHDHYVFVGHDSLLSLQKKYKNTFTIGIPDIEFTEHQYAEFNFPKPIEEMLLYPEVLDNIASKACASRCKACGEKFNTKTALREHYINSHTHQWRCPDQGCTYENLKASMLEFARHLYYHNHEHPAMKHPHICIGE